MLFCQTISIGEKIVGMQPGLIVLQCSKYSLAKNILKNIQAFDRLNNTVFNGQNDFAL